MEDIQKNEEVSNSASTTVTTATTAAEVAVTEATTVVDAVQEPVESAQDNSDVFITENDTFDIKISYYKSNNEIYVEGVDEDFDTKNASIKTIDITFKYPSHGDYEAIVSQTLVKSPEKMSYLDILQMELTRIVVLIRRWSINAEFTRMVELDPKIIKSMTNKVRDRIGIKGIM